MPINNKLWAGPLLIFILGALWYFWADTASPPTMDHSMPMTAGTASIAAGPVESVMISDAMFLSQIGLIRGHLNVGVDLYREGAQEASASHMKHPESEIYAELLPALAARNAPGFADELAALAAGVEQSRAVAEVETAYQHLLQAISRTEQSVTNLDAATLAEVIATLVQEAAREYVLALADDLSLENAHEYQDSLGFVRVANEWLGKLEGMAGAAAVTIILREQIEFILQAWPALQPPAILRIDPAVINAAAERIAAAAAALR